jgi:arylsulfatase A-like enzyme
MKDKINKLTLVLTLLTSMAFANEPPNIIVIFTDDHGFADLSIQGQVSDIKTPHIDQLAKEGVLATAGYITAPQCTPSRAGLLSGRYQERFGLDNNQTIPFPLDEKMIALRMKEAGYVTGMAGKWHLEPNRVQYRWLKEHIGEKEKYTDSDVPFKNKIPYMASEKGFDYCFQGAMNNYWANYDLEGNEFEPKMMKVDGYRLDIQTDAALTFIRKNHDKPFFFFLPYYGPHVPLQATEKYLSRFPEDMPERRRMCLAMMSAIDDGVGKIKETLKKYGIDDNTIIFFAGDNGAPLAGDNLNSNFKSIPVEVPGSWDGSLNTPFLGEKGMLSEGGIRTPFVINWPKGLPQGKVYDRPISSLDFAATSLALAGMDIPQELDGVNIVPYLRDDLKGDPHEALYWRFWDQAAIRKGDWKYLKCKEREYLFNVASDLHENKNLIAENPKLAKKMKEMLKSWCSQLKYPGLEAPTERSALHWIAYYLEGEAHD